MKKATLLVFAALLCIVTADIYMHNPRGSNNRLNESGTNRNNNNRMCDTQNNAKGGYTYGPPMYYYVGSQLSVEWTNQHGCGIDSEQKNTHCEVILQYMCGGEVRDGATTDTIPDDANQYNVRIDDPTGDDTFGGGEVYRYGMHENYDYYQNCKKRERNRGLFIADRNLGGSTAIFTRQNNNGGRSGFECPEERDYYPYWHPSPWKDIAILTSDTSRCDYYTQKSQNNRNKNYCTVPEQNNRKACNEAGGQWKSQGSNGASGPYCGPAALSRDNHLGNGIGGVNNYFNWTIPDDPNGHCVLRIRYNISTGDYNNWRTDSNKNGAKSPVKNNPTVSYGGRNLTLALNTAQTGRTFQDRSYTFAIRSRPSDVTDTSRIFNLNVRGKRGNIVQVYPAVEYDFCPVRMTVRSGDHIHFQFTGGDTNPQGNDGEGTRGTDRSNMVETNNIRGNYPASLGASNYFADDTAMTFAFLNQQNCATLEELQATHGNNNDAINRDPRNCAKLNAASRYFDGGLQEVRSSPGEYHFVSTRNNNFSNRSQKGTIDVVPFLPTWAIVLISISAFVCLMSIVVSGLAYYGKTHADSWLGQLWIKLT